MEFWCNENIYLYLSVAQWPAVKTNISLINEPPQFHASSGSLTPLPKPITACKKDAQNISKIKKNIN